MKIVIFGNHDSKAVAEILATVRRMEERQVRIMGLVDDIKQQQADTKASIRGVQGDVTDLVAQIQALKDQIAQGSPATVADLESILADAKDIAASVKGIDDSVPGTPTP